MGISSVKIMNGRGSVAIVAKQSFVQQAILLYGASFDELGRPLVLSFVFENSLAFL